MKMLLLTYSCFLFGINLTMAQWKKEYTGSRWKFIAGSGLFADIRHLNILNAKENKSSPPVYKDRKEHKIVPGKTDRLELMLVSSNEQSAISFAFQYAMTRHLYGSGRDPLQVWNGIKKYTSRIHCSLNYYKLKNINANNSVESSLGFLFAGIKESYPYYGTTNGTAFINESFPGYSWQAGVQINIRYMYRITEIFSLGSACSTYYLHRRGIPGASLEANLAIHFIKRR
jgi:hypothetical protein